jgi:hypothetical protein
MIIAGGVLFIFALILIGARFVPILGLGYFIAYGMLLVGLGIAVIVSAFRTNLVQGLLTFFVPLYALYYVYGISRNRVFMGLTPLALFLWAGMFLLPMEKAGFETTPHSSGQSETLRQELGAAQPVSGSASTDRSERVVAGYAVTVSPRSPTSSYGSASGGNRIAMPSDGKTLVFEAQKPLRIEEWRVGDHRILIANNELFVNERSYGALSPGAQILVDHGTVFIGGHRAAEAAGTVRIRQTP